VRLFARNGHDFSKRFPLDVAAVAALPVRWCLLDSEAMSATTAGSRYSK